MEVATPVPKTALPTPRPAERAFPRTTAPQKVQPARTTELQEGFQQCAPPTAARRPGETVSRTRIVPPESTEDVFRFEAVTWRAPTTSASRTRTARATYPASVATRHRAPTATGASAAATAALTTTAAPEATAHQASSQVAFACARWPVIRQRTAMRERQRCPVGAARVVARATSAVRQTTPAQTTASVPETVPAPTSPMGVGPASHAAWCLEVTAAVLPSICSTSTISPTPDTISAMSFMPMRPYLKLDHPTSNAMLAAGLFAALVFAACGGRPLTKRVPGTGGTTSTGGILGSGGTDSTATTSATGGQGGTKIIGSSGPGATGSGGVTSATGPVSTWVADLVSAYCAWAVRCGQFPNQDICQAYGDPRFAAVGFNMATAAVVAVAEGTAEFNATQAASCLATMSGLACDIDFVNLPSVPTSCRAAFSGSFPSGGVCIDDVQCAPGASCVGDSSFLVCKGTCTPISAPSCRTNDDCPTQQYCSGNFTAGSGIWSVGQCQDFISPGATAGDICGRPVLCAPGLSCQGGGPFTPGCEPDAAEGEKCGPDAMYAVCRAGLACVTPDDGSILEATCMRPAGLGDACTSLLQCGGQYQVSDLICDKTGSHTCVHKPSTGPCVVVDGNNTCDPLTSYCDATSGTCQPWLSQGAHCDPHAASGIDPCGPSGACEGTVCMPRLRGCISG